MHKQDYRESPTCRLNSKSVVSSRCWNPLQILVSPRSTRGCSNTRLRARDRRTSMHYARRNMFLFCWPRTLQFASAFLDKMRWDELSVSSDVAMPKRLGIHIMKVLMSRHTSATLACVRLHPSRGRHVSTYLTQQAARWFHRLADRFTRSSRSFSLHAFSRQWWALQPPSSQLKTFVKSVSFFVTNCVVHVANLCSLAFSVATPCS